MLSRRRREPIGRSTAEGEGEGGGRASGGRLSARATLAVGVCVILASCGAGAKDGAAQPPGSGATVRTGAAQTTTVSTTTTSTTRLRSRLLHPLARPASLRPFAGSRNRSEGTWRAAGRRVEGMPAVYETTLVPPGGSEGAGIAWMDTRLLSARLYSGSESPGGGRYRYSAPIRRGSARYLVAAFNGGFIMNVAGGGYYAEGRTIDPLRAGAASLVIYANGSVDVGAWGSDVRMTPNVRSVRQNLVPLVANGRPTAAAESVDWESWGATCGPASCTGEPGIKHQWRSGAGITANGALVYVQGPSLEPLQVAQLLVRAHVVRGMQLDINPYWPIFATYRPQSEDGLASAANGRKLLGSTTQSPATFFDAAWARDFFTMSARHPSGG
ncbi:MAG: hypothetical protein ACYCX7_04745 [Solirubrobacteraceae bacterium]